MGGRPRALVVDDEENIRYLLRTVLEGNGYEVTTVGGGRAALDASRAGDFAVMLLDVMLPDLDGLAVVERLRAGGDDLPVLLLTARDATDDKVRGLRAGSDDYVTKPFSLEEVVARVDALVRRSGRRRADDDGVLRVDDLELDDAAHVVRRGGEELDLTPTEYRLLHYLLVNRGRALSKDQILNHVWEYGYDGNVNVVETFVSYLRRKVDRPGVTPLIQTVRGVGYSLRVR